MKPQNLHAQEDRLLDFVYGELPPLEARAVESHLEGCARCSELLNDIRGVRTTMAQLPMEPAPDAGLESLLAYAQQAARNAAAGPAPKPAWWRRWLVPVVGVAAVCTFGIVSIQVSKSVAIKPDLSAAKSESLRTKEAPAPEIANLTPPPAPTAAAPAPAQMQAPSAPPPQVAKAAPAEAYQDTLGEGDMAKATGMTPPANAPAAKLDKALLAKETSGKKAFVSGPKKAADWSNAGAGAGFERAKDAEDEALALEEKQAAEKKAKSYEYEQRDAMTQMAPLRPPKASPAGQTTPSPEPVSAPGAAQPTAEGSAGADGMLAQASMQQQAIVQEESTRSSLRLNRGRSSATETASAPADGRAENDFDDLFDAKPSEAKREQQAAMPAPPPPVTAAASPAPKPSKPSTMATRAPKAGSLSADDKSGAAESEIAELSKLANAALSSGNRVLEAQYLRQALAAGATGSERLGLLNRLCDAEFSIGRRAQAVEACKLVLEESPRSGAAQVARKRLKTESFDDDSAKKASPGSKASGKAAEMESAPAAAPVKH